MWFTLIIAFLSLVALMVIHEFGHFIIAKKFGVRVEEFGIGYPPRVFGKQIGETLYSLNIVPLGAFVKIYDEEGDDLHLPQDSRSFSRLAIWKRMLIVLGGVLAFWIAAAIIFSVVSLIGAQVPIGDQSASGLSHPQVVVMQAQAGSPAASAGLEPGDHIISIQDAAGNHQINYVADLQKTVDADKGHQIGITVNRNGKNVLLSLTPRTSYPANEGPSGLVVERIASVIERVPWWLAPWRGIQYTGQTTGNALIGIWGFFASLFAGKGVPAGAQLAGPVGITIFLSEAVSLGLGFFLYFIGSLSVLLAIFNLFPIPALDGGKLLFLIIELIKGRPISVRFEQVLTITCFFLLIAMSLFVTIHFDIPRVMDYWKAGL